MPIAVMITIRMIVAIAVTVAKTDVIVIITRTTMIASVVQLQSEGLRTHLKCTKTSRTHLRLTQSKGCSLDWGVADW